VQNGLSNATKITQCMQHNKLFTLKSTKYKNSSGDEIANMNFCTTTYMERPAPTPIEPTC